MPNHALPPVSVLLPVIRPAKAARCVEAMLNDPTCPPLQVLMEEDTERVGCPKMVARLMARAEHDLICFLGDDTIPDTGMLAIAIYAMQDAFPDGWGMVGLEDRVRFIGRERAATHWLAHRKLLPLVGGEWFCTQYRHCYCDNELMERARDIGRYVFCESATLYHDHPINDPKADDLDYRRIYSRPVYNHDLILYRKRRANGWT